MTLDLSKYTAKHMLLVEGKAKRSVLDDKEKGELGNERYIGIDEHQEHILFDQNITKEELTELVVDRLREHFNFKKIDRSWLMVTGSRVILSISEDADGNVIDDVHAYWRKGKDVYSAYYDYELSINGLKVCEADLITLFDFES